MGLIPYKNEPGLDWSDESNVEAMRAALEEVGDSLGKSYPLVIPIRIATGKFQGAMVTPTPIGW